MKKCIWCSRAEDVTSFKRVAHTVPQALGGKYICENVCDDCNSYFGQHHEGDPSIETVIKETFNITRYRLLGKENIGKNKTLHRFSSIYFKVDFQKHKMDLKGSYKFHPRFQERIGKQLKRGLYKMFLEESERQRGDAHDDKYNFIRTFARYGLGDLPTFYFERWHGIIAMSQDWLHNPSFLLETDMQMKYLVNEPGFTEVEFLGHVFSLATSPAWEMCLDNYVKKTLEAKREFFRSIREVNRFNDIDLTLSIINDAKRS